PPYSTASATPGGVPMRSARFRRGSRGGARRPGAAGGVPEIPKIGVVEVDPNFRPRGDVVPPPKPPIGPPSPGGPASGAGQERGERGGRGGGRGGRGGRDRGPRGENGERGERGERGGRGRRGGRGGRGRGPRRFESDQADATNHDAPPVQTGRRQSAETSATPPTRPPPTLAHLPRSEPAESFWSRLKLVLPGGRTSGGG